MNVSSAHRLAIFLLVASLSAFSKSSAKAENVESQLVKVLETNRDTVGPWLRQRVENNNRRLPPGSSAGGGEKIDIPCRVCRLLASTLFADISNGASTEDIIQVLNLACTSLFGLDEEICLGNLTPNVPIIVWLAQNYPDVDIIRVCAEALGSTDCDAYEPNGDLWSVDLPDVPKPPVDRPPIPEGTPALKILHLADIHLDPLYQEGSESLCNYTICCQSVSGPGEISPAGMFGSYEPCDTPQIALEETFQHILDTHDDIDMIFFTGDLPPHDTWRQSVEGNIAIMDQAMETMREYFGDKAVLNLIGNHEPYPLNVFSFEELQVPDELKSDYVYEAAWRNWEQWMPVDQQENVIGRGHYSVSPREGLRVIGVNNMFGYVFNFFIWSDLPDPNGELAWLAQELQKAEDNGESVFILGHIPPGNPDTTPVWSHNFNKIINRYENIVKGQFYGHTHWDEFNLFFNEEGRPSNVAYITPSVTTYEELNYGYRIFHVDGLRGPESTWTILDHETWVYDLDTANAEGKPTWYKLYNMRDQYQMDDLSPESYAQLAQSLATDDGAFATYLRNFWKNSTRTPECDGECRADYVCAALTSDTSDQSRCAL